jgi:hypothetical protein
VNSTKRSQNLVPERAVIQHHACEALKRLHDGE